MSHCNVVGVSWRCGSVDRCQVYSSLSRDPCTPFSQQIERAGTAILIAGSVFSIGDCRVLGAVWEGHETRENGKGQKG